MCDGGERSCLCLVLAKKFIFRNPQRQPHWVWDWEACMYTRHDDELAARRACFVAPADRSCCHLSRVSLLFRGRLAAARGYGVYCWCRRRTCESSRLEGRKMANQRKPWL